MTNFFDKIKKSFGFLYKKYSLLETERFYDKQHFGNAKLVLSSKSLRFIFTRDRDFDSIGISPILDQKEEFDLQIIKAYILSQPIEGEYLKSISFSAIAKFVSSNYGKIEDAFSKTQYSRTKNNLKKLQDIRYKKLIATP